MFLSPNHIQKSRYWNGSTPIFDSTGSRGQSNQHEEEVHDSSSSTNSPDVQARRNPRRNRVRPVCHTEEQIRRRR
ncbi:hypothetical protein Sjap_017209 [Stephania japonica]|uniref:Uncharacterized protein n=1 Tax=Stephania japonica TaxID=461633 RepID=A0AAP0NJM2_9MAGN